MKLAIEKYIPCLFKNKYFKGYIIRNSREVPLYSKHMNEDLQSLNLRIPG